MKEFPHSVVFLKLFYLSKLASAILASVIVRPWWLCGLGLKGGCWAGLFLMALLPSAAELLFCAWIYIIVYAELHSRARLLELVVVANCSFLVDYHSRRHQPRPGADGKIFASSTASWYLCTLWVRLSDGIFQKCQELRLGLFRSSTFPKYAAPYVNLRAQGAVIECFDWLVDAKKPRLCQTSGCFWSKSLMLGGSSRVGTDVSNQVSFDRFPLSSPNFIHPGYLKSTMGDKSSWDTWWRFSILKHLFYFICF